MLYPLLLYFAFIKSVSTVVFSCGGYVKSADIPIDYSQIQVKLLNSDGNLKFEAGCNPSNGFYMIPVYAKGEYTIRIFAPEGIYFEPNSVSLNIGGVNDPCSKGEDINFLLKGLGIKGALRYSDNSNAKNVKVSLLSSNGSSVTTVSTDDKGIYQFNVLPGKYLVSLASIGGTSECVEGDKISVEVVASPVQISSDMKILGHELTVEIMSKNQALPDITVNLYSSNSVQLRNCQNSDPTSSQVEGLNLICSSKSNQLGQVQFKCVPSGQYLLVPRLITNKVQFAFSPKSEKFAVGTKSKKITFAVSGFISRGRVLIQAKSVENAEIYVNGELRTTSDKNGWYTTEGLHDGRYSVTAKKKGYAFGTVIVHLSNLNAEIPDLHVESAEVCARIEAEDEVQISTNFVIVAERTGQRASVLKAHKEEKVCTMLPLGRYIISVDSTKKITVAPRQQVVSTLDGPKQDVIFVKTTTKIIAKTKCKGKCPQLKVELRKDGQMIRTLSGTDEFVFEKVASDSYTIKIVHSGEICWDTPAIDVVIEGSDSYSVEFVQQGYLVMINSSHSAELNWEHKMQRNLSGSVNMEAGISRICLPELGVYSVAVQGCHTFGVSSDQLIVPQDSLLSAMAEKAQILVRIIAKESVAKLPDFRIIVNAGDERRVVEAPVSKKSSEFNYVFHLKMGDVGVVTISPESDLYLFLPVAYRFEFDGECHEMHEPFVATKGIFLHGSVTPAIENVEIKLIHKTDSNVIQKSVTDSNGRYRIGPLQDVMSFNIEAAKEGYEFEQMETFGNIKAWRLSQLQVVVTDIQTSLPLHDVLLSLSGTGNYRSSNLLNETGWMNFIGLHAGEYFLQPFLQEYRFEPSTTSVKINEGETVVAELKGRRFAYSATGSVTYLGGSPATIVIVEAVSEQCNQLQEEDTTSESGIYRIRGLHPNCIYRLVLKSSEGQRLKSYPTYCDISVREEDVGNINFALTDIERPVDIVGSVEFADATPPQFKIVLYRGDSMIQHAIVDSPSQVFFFDIPYVDYLEYTVRYEPSHVSADYKYQTSEVSFSANSTVIRVHLRVDIQKSGDVEIAFTSYFAFPFFLFIGYIFFYHEKIIPSTATIMDKLSKLQTMKHNAVPWENQDHHRKRMKAKKVIHADANAGIR